MLRDGVLTWIGFLVAIPLREVIVSEPDVSHDLKSGDCTYPAAIAAPRKGPSQ